MTNTIKPLNEVRKLAGRNLTSEEQAKVRVQIQLGLVNPYDIAGKLGIAIKGKAH